MDKGTVSEHLIEIIGEKCNVTVYKATKTSYAASDEYEGHHVEAKGASSKAGAIVRSRDKVKGIEVSGG